MEDMEHRSPLRPVKGSALGQINISGIKGTSDDDDDDAGYGSGGKNDDDDDDGSLQEPDKTPQSPVKNGSQVPPGTPQPSPGQNAPPPPPLQPPPAAVAAASKSGIAGMPLPEGYIDNDSGVIGVEATGQTWEEYTEEHSRSGDLEKLKRPWNAVDNLSFAKAKKLVVLRAGRSRANRSNVPAVFRPFMNKGLEDELMGTLPGGLCQLKADPESNDGGFIGRVYKVKISKGDVEASIIECRYSDAFVRELYNDWGYDLVHECINQGFTDWMNVSMPIFCKEFTDKQVYTKMRLRACGALECKTKCGHFTAIYNDANGFLKAAQACNKLSFPRHLQAKLEQMTRMHRTHFKMLGAGSSNWSKRYDYATPLVGIRHLATWEEFDCAGKSIFNSADKLQDDPYIKARWSNVPLLRQKLLRLDMADGHYHNRLVKETTFHLHLRMLTKADFWAEDGTKNGITPTNQFDPFNPFTSPDQVMALAIINGHCVAFCRSLPNVILDPSEPHGLAVTQRNLNNLNGGEKFTRFEKVTIFIEMPPKVKTFHPGSQPAGTVPDLSSIHGDRTTAATPGLRSCADSNNAIRAVPIPSRWPGAHNSNAIRNQIAWQQHNQAGPPAPNYFNGPHTYNRGNYIFPPPQPHHGGTGYHQRLPQTINHGAIPPPPPPPPPRQPAPGYHYHPRHHQRGGW